MYEYMYEYVRIDIKILSSKIEKRKYTVRSTRRTNVRHVPLFTLNNNSHWSKRSPSDHTCLTVATDCPDKRFTKVVGLRRRGSSILNKKRTSDWVQKRG